MKVYISSPDPVVSVELINHLETNYFIDTVVRPDQCNSDYYLYWISSRIDDMELCDWIIVILPENSERRTYLSLLEFMAIEATLTQDRHKFLIVNLGNTYVEKTPEVLSGFPVYDLSGSWQLDNRQYYYFMCALNKIDGDYNKEDPSFSNFNTMLQITLGMEKI